MKSQPLTEIKNAIQAHETLLSRIANQWTTLGASSLTLTVDDLLLHSWPSACIEGIPSLEALLMLGRLEASLCLQAVVLNPAWQADLDIDAQIIATLLNQSIELEELTDELVSSQDQLLTMYDSARAMRKILDEDMAIERIGTEARRLTGCTATFIVLFDSETARIYHTPQPLIPDETILQLVESIRTFSGRIMLNENELQAHVQGVKNLLIMPVQIDEKIGAALGLINKAEGFTSPDIKLAEVLSISLGSKIEHISLYNGLLKQQKTQVEMSLAHQVQARLLPHSPPQIAGLDIYGAARPAREVGGDFFNFMHRQHLPLTFTVGDVAGKGMSAALVMAMTRTAFRSAANLQFALLTPEEILQQINDELYEDYSDLELFTTIFIGQYEAERSLLHYANAGHSPVIFCPAQGDAIFLPADGPAVGVLPQCLSKDHSRPLKPGDVLVVGTDGFPEASNKDGDFYGYDALLRDIEASRHGSAEDIAMALYNAVAMFEDNTTQHDDQTIIVIKRI